MSPITLSFVMVLVIAWICLLPEAESRAQLSALIVALLVLHEERQSR